MDSIRAKLASTFSGRRVTGLNLSKSISRTVPSGLSLGFTAAAAGGGMSSASICGGGYADGKEEEVLGLMALREAVENRRRARPEGIERQVMYSNVHQPNITVP